MATGAIGRDALYGDQPGHDSVFVRFVNALDAKVNVESDRLPSLSLGTGDSERIGHYSVINREDVSSITFKAKTDGAEFGDKIKLQPGTETSIVLRKDGDKLRAVTLTTPFEMNTSRAVLSFVNAAPACGPSSLVLRPANVPIFADVPVDAERSRRINPVSALVSAACGELGAATSKFERPEAGSAHSLWLLSLQGRPVLIFSSDALPTWHP